MFALKRPTKEKTLDSLFGSEEFGCADDAFWDEGRRGRLRRSTSFESILADPKAQPESAVTVKVVDSMRNILVQSKNTFSAISNKSLLFGVTQPIQQQPPLAAAIAQPKPAAQSKVIGSVSHMLLQSKNTLQSTSKKSFGAMDQALEDNKTSTYKFDCSGDFKYPSPKKTNMFFDMMDKKKEKRISIAKDISFLEANKTRLGTDDGQHFNKLPVRGLQRQQSDSSLYLGPTKSVQENAIKTDYLKPKTTVVTTDHRLNMQLNNSDHSLHQRRGRRFGNHKSERQKETEIEKASSATFKRAGSDPTLPMGTRRAPNRHKSDLAKHPIGRNNHREGPQETATGKESSAVKRTGSDPTLPTWSRRAPNRHKSDLAHHHLYIHPQPKIRLPVMRNKSESNIDRNILTQARSRRIVIGLTKGEDDDDMHNAMTDKQKVRRRRLKTERGHGSSKSDLDLDDLEPEPVGADPNGISFTFPESTPFEGDWQKSDHSLDIFDDLHASSHQKEPSEGRHRGHPHKHRNEKDRSRPMKRHSSNKEIRNRRHDPKSRSKSMEKNHTISREIDVLKQKLKVRQEEKKLNAFEMQGHASCDFEERRSIERDIFNFDDFENNAFRTNGNTVNDADPTRLEPPIVETTSLINLINTLDFPIPAVADDTPKGTEDSPGLGKGHSNHTASSKASRKARARPPSKKPFSRTSSTKQVEWNDSGSSISLGMSSTSLESSIS